MGTTLRDIAEAVGVSVGTVSRVLNGRAEARVSAGTVARVLAEAERRQYTPNPIARALVTGRRNMVGLSVPYLWYPFAPQVMNFVQQALNPHGFGIAIQGAEAGVERYVADLEAIEAQVDAVLAVERADYLPSYLAQRGRRRIPVVSAGSSVVREVDWVQVDLTVGTREALEHLAGQGRRRLAYAVPDISHHPDEQREATYLTFMAAAGLEPEFVIVPGGRSANAREAIASYAASHGLPEAMFCCNDVTALGIYRGVCDLGARVGHDCALVGCDGIEEVAYLEAPLSTVVQPVEAMCRLATDFLARRLADPGAPQQTAQLEARLVVRASSGGA